MKNLVKAAALSAVLIGGTAAAAHADLITNGGFETGDFTGWTRGGNLGATFVGNSPNAPHSGNFAAELGPVGSDGTLAQTFATIIGDTYQVSYWHIYNAAATPPSDFSVTFNGTTLFSEANVNPPSPLTWTQYTFDVIASLASSTLQFAFRNDPSYQGLDDVSVTDLGTPGTVPEPSSLALFGAALAGFGFMARRRRHA
ncbi:MAG TPA: PEP-CTERM sorting domain-containing protein [Alphaproteobacteria bacterium]|nr:PEP-CTERM sorting domain-containing protein [Alphaproteobacteria bacterium]